MSRRYRFLPFRFERLGNQVLLVNDVGEYHFLDGRTFELLVQRQIEPCCREYLDLKSKSIIWDSQLPGVVDLLATKYRTKKQFLYNFTSLHMFVVTRRCNQKCLYCHASSIESQGEGFFDMDPLTAGKCVDLALKSTAIGGESLYYSAHWEEFGSRPVALPGSSTSKSRGGMCGSPTTRWSFSAFPITSWRLARTSVAPGLCIGDNY
jgi:hypothetical protein